MRKAVITVVGKDATGIIARVCTALAGKKVNILEISQTIIDGFFNMIMIVDYAAMEDDFSDMVSLLDSLGEEIGVSIRCQREEIFTSMHRI
ncbi:ACT domain-containing protein [Parascardovia denticolens]